MTIKTTGIRNLKTSLARQIQAIATGSTVVVEQHNSATRLQPKNEHLSLRDEMLNLRAAGILNWQGDPPPRYQPRRPTTKLKSTKLASEILLEDRR